MGLIDVTMLFVSLGFIVCLGNAFALAGQKGARIYGVLAAIALFSFIGLVKVLMMAEMAAMLHAK